MHISQVMNLNATSAYMACISKEVVTSTVHSASDLEMGGGRGGAE
jgi:hypothetical protein